MLVSAPGANSGPRFVEHSFLTPLSATADKLVAFRDSQAIEVDARLLELGDQFGVLRLQSRLLILQVRVLRRELLRLGGLVPELDLAAGVQLLELLVSEDAARDDRAGLVVDAVVRQGRGADNILSARMRLRRRLECHHGRLSALTRL